MKQFIKRKHIRLTEYNYAEEGYYFITVCTNNHECLLSKIELCRGEHCSPVLTSAGKIVEKYLKSMEKIYTNIKIDEYIIMPNHIHILLIIHKGQLHSISKIMQQFKGKITKELQHTIWQKSFYEHIIRNEKEYLKIKEYIIHNPTNWAKDMYYEY